jgi:hypothetical protein
MVKQYAANTPPPSSFCQKKKKQPIKIILSWIALIEYYGMKQNEINILFHCLNDL